MQDTGYKIKDKEHRASGIGHHASGIMHRDRRGITLIELVITMVLMGIVALIVANALSTGVKGNLVTDNRKEGLDQARVAMERMIREIRNLRSSADVGTGNATQFCFTDTSGTQINFSYSGSDIKRGTGNCTAGSGATLSTKITSSFSFGYVRADGTVDDTFSAANTKRIRITIPCTISSETVTLQSEVWPRSL